MITFDPRTSSQQVFTALDQIRKNREKVLQKEGIDPKKFSQDERLREQKRQSVELYTYLSSWGLIRLKAEEKALKGDKDEKTGQKKNRGRIEVIQAFFKCLNVVANVQGQSTEDEIKTLSQLPIDEYLGLTGKSLALAQEFSFWATAVYWDISGED